MLAALHDMSRANIDREGHETRYGAVVYCSWHRLVERTVQRLHLKNKTKIFKRFMKNNNNLYISSRRLKFSIKQNIFGNTTQVVKS